MSVLGVLAETSPVLKVGGAASDLSATGRAVVTDQNNNIVEGICGLVFDIPQNDTISLTAQITDHWTETNIAIQDHIAIEPVKITLTGIIAELVWEKSKGEAAAEQALQRSMELPGMQPEIAQAGTEYLSGYQELKRQKDQGTKIYNDLNTFYDKNMIATTKQGKAYGILEGYFYTRTLCTVNTPWKYFTNMAIENLTFNQDETTRDATTVTVTFKQINSIDVAATKVTLAPIPASQRNDIKKQGATKNVSVFKTITNSIVAPFQSTGGQ